MKILLEELPHQLADFRQFNDAFHGIDETTADLDRDYVFANPVIYGRGHDNANIDIKMETGDRENLRRSRTMYDLHQKYGLFKLLLLFQRLQ